MASLLRIAAVKSTVRSSIVSRSMATGAVKWFNSKNGFGFISPDNKELPDVFVHQSAIQANGYRFLKEGEKVHFDTTQTDRGVQAINVRDAEGNPFNRAREGDAPAAGGAGGAPRRPMRPRGDRPAGDRPAGGDRFGAGGARPPRRQSPRPAGAGAPAASE